jgi:DNA-binding LacI/PurR family transcriptional regulator
MRVTLQDVARAAGVTPSTVSYALSQKGTLSAATRARIIKCAQDLGYRPNLVARGLVTQRTQTIGLLVGDIANPFYGSATQVVERTAHAAGFRVFFGNTDRDDELGRSLLDDLVARRVDGIIAIPGGLPPDRVRAVTTMGLPLVWCLWEDEPGLAPSVDLDYLHGGQIAAEHLLALGHRRIGVVTHRPAPGRAQHEHRLRVRAFRTALETAGTPLDESLLLFGDSTIESGLAAGRALLERASPPTAIFATNDLMALGVLGAARERRIAVPDELSIIGFDDIFVAGWTYPPLTTVHVDIQEIMTTTTHLLLDLIAGRDPTPPAVSVPKLVIRASTGPCGARAR